MSANKENNIVLSTRDLSIGYPQKLIASEINLHIQKGALTGVIGINGSGKSTLLKTLTGDLPKKSGEIFIEGRKLSELSSKQIAEFISLVLANPVFSSNLSVKEVVALGRHPYTNWLGLLSEKDKEAVREALRKIDMYDSRNRNCDELSDGQLQKVFIARALAQDTDLIVLDEPTNHLDLYHKAFVFKLLKKLSAQSGKAIVLATHELNLAMQLCDQIILVNQGKIIQDSPKNLIEREVLHELFPKDLISFDKATQSFKVHQE